MDRRPLPSQLLGAYLNACVLLATITGHDPRALGPQEQAAAALNIAPTDAATLQRLAYEQVQASPRAEAMPHRGKLKTKHKRAKATSAR